MTLIKLALIQLLEIQIPKHRQELYNCILRGAILSKTVNEEDLEVTMNISIKVSEQYRIATSQDLEK